MESWTFAYVADIHVGTPRSYRFQPAWNENWRTAREQIVDLNPEFLIVGGDLTRDGMDHRFELEQIKADLDSLPFPYHVIPGNHDEGNKYLEGSKVSINQASVDRFRSVFSPTEWTFVHRGVRFSAFDALLAGSGLQEEEEMWMWLEAQETELRESHHTWFIHPALFIYKLQEPNREPEKSRQLGGYRVDKPHRSRMMQVFKETGAELVIAAHIHCQRRVQVDGITFYFAPGTAFEGPKLWHDGESALGFLRCEVTKAGVEPNVVPLNRKSNLKGYGPGGSPLKEGRDYSLAWEKPSLEEMGLV